jgi:hypothetical protein
MRAGLVTTSGTTALELAIFHPGQVDRAERGCGQGGEHARMAGDRGRDALAARETGADELVGVGAVHLRTRWAAGGAAGLARHRQHPAGLVDRRIPVQQFPGGTVDLVNAAAQQDRLDAPACLPDRAIGEGKGGHGCAPLAGGGRVEADRWPGADVPGVMIGGAMPRLAWSVCLPLRR